MFKMKFTRPGFINLMWPYKQVLLNVVLDNMQEILGLLQQQTGSYKMESSDAVCMSNVSDFVLFLSFIWSLVTGSKADNPVSSDARSGFVLLTTQKINDRCQRGVVLWECLFVLVNSSHKSRKEFSGQGLHRQKKYEVIYSRHVPLGICCVSRHHCLLCPGRPSKLNF